MANPIWKDYFVTLGTGASSFLFRILADDGTNQSIIYTGRAYQKPGESSIQIRINDICADFLRNKFPNLIDRDFTGNGSPVSFHVESYVSNSWVEKDEVEFTNDWSYDYDFNVDTMGLSFPVNGRIDLRQWVMYSSQNESMLTATITLKDGSSFNIYIPVQISADFNNDFNEDFATMLRNTQPGTAVFDLSQWGDVQSISIGNTTYEVVTDCGEWALYYVNAYGGWDTFLIENLVSMRDELTRFTKASVYDNRDSSNRGVTNYLNELSRIYTINTSWLTDAQSERMHHLLNSTEVYLCNINTGMMMPVVLNNTTTEYKTFKTNGHRMVNYTFEATLAQERIRR